MINPKYSHALSALKKENYRKYHGKDVFNESEKRLNKILSDLMKVMAYKHIKMIESKKKSGGQRVNKEIKDMHYI